MNDPAYKNLRLSDFPVLTDVPATEDTIRIIMHAERAFNWMLESAAVLGHAPLEVKLWVCDRPGEQGRLLMKAVAAVEGDAETIKRFYETKKQTQRPDAD
jgi:hypothetical protein